MTGGDLAADFVGREKLPEDEDDPPPSRPITGEDEAHALCDIPASAAPASHWLPSWPCTLATAAWDRLISARRGLTPDMLGLGSRSGPRPAGANEASVSDERLDGVLHWEAKDASGSQPRSPSFERRSRLSLVEVVKSALPDPPSGLIRSVAYGS